MKRHDSEFNKENFSYHLERDQERKLELSRMWGEAWLEAFEEFNQERRKDKIKKSKSEPFYKKFTKNNPFYKR